MERWSSKFLFGPASSHRGGSVLADPPAVSWSKRSAASGSTTRGQGCSRECSALRVGSTLKGKPQGRDRHETRPAGGGRSKAPRAWETLRGQQNPGLVPPGLVAARYWEDVEGERTAREAATGGLRPPGSGVRTLHSEGERKVTRVFAHGPHSSWATVGTNTSEASCEAKAIEGAGNQSSR